MMIRELQTVDDVVDALGGTADVARLTGKHMQTVSSWRARKRFAPSTFIVISEALHRVGCQAPRALWGMLEPVGDSVQ